MINPVFWHNSFRFLSGFKLLFLHFLSALFHPSLAFIFLSWFSPAPFVTFHHYCILRRSVWVSPILWWICLHSSCGGVRLACPSCNDNVSVHHTALQSLLCSSENRWWALHKSEGSQGLQRSRILALFVSECNIAVTFFAVMVRSSAEKVQLQTHCEEHPPGLFSICLKAVVNIDGHFHATRESEFIRSLAEDTELLDWVFSLTLILTNCLSKILSFLTVLGGHHNSTWTVYTVLFNSC